MRLKGKMTMLNAYPKTLNKLVHPAGGFMTRTAQSEQHEAILEAYSNYNDTKIAARDNWNRPDDDFPRSRQTDISKTLSGARAALVTACEGAPGELISDEIKEVIS